MLGERSMALTPVGEHRSLVFSFLDSDPSPRLEGVEGLPGHSSYFLGADPAQWRAGVPHYGKLRYGSLYRNVDLLFYGTQDGNLEYDFVIAPGGDASRIRFVMEGAASTKLTHSGDLDIHLPGAGRVRLARPVAYQETLAGRVPVAAAYRVEHQRGRTIIAFRIGAHDATLPLIIDPVLSYGSYLGGNAEDNIQAVAVDPTGALYVTGRTLSTNLPGSSGSGSLGACHLNAVPACSGDAFVTKINPAGSAIVYSVYVGGNGNTETGTSIALDADMNAYVTGMTNSSDFPVTSGVVDNVSSGVFAFKLNAAGNQLVYATRVGGSGTSVNSLSRIKADAAGNAYIASNSVAAPFSLVNGFNSTFATGEGYLVKLNPSATAVLYSTLIGGSGQDIVNDLAIDGSGVAYIVGITGSADFPLKNAIKGSKGADDEAFLVKIDTGQTGSNSLLYGSFLGGTASDDAKAVALDSQGNIYVAGQTNSTDFPTVSGYQTTFPAGFLQGWMTKLNNAGSSRLYSTFFAASSVPLGQTFLDFSQPSGIAVEGNRAWVVGRTNSSGLPMVSALKGTCTVDANLACDVGFVAEFDTSLTGTSSLLFSSFLGGTRTASSAQAATGVAADTAGNVYVSGYTNSADFAPLVSSFQPACGSSGTACSDGFVLKIGNAALPAFVVLSTRNLNLGDVQVGVTSAAFPVTLSNLGGTSLNIASIVANNEFSAGGTCGSSLAANANCTIQVTITPSTTGAKAGSLTIVTDASGSPHEVALSANSANLNPVPTLGSVSPTARIVNSGAFTLTANGTNFLPSSVVRWNGNNRTTTFVNSTQLTASILASDVTSVTNAQVTVFNPSPGGGVSNFKEVFINVNTPPVGQVDSALDLADNDSVVKQSGTVRVQGWAADANDGAPVTSVAVRLNQLGRDVYIVDSNNFRIRKVNAVGTISTFAGSGTAGFLGDTGSAASARIFPSDSFEFGGSMAMDNTGNIYFCDMGNHRVRKIAAGTTIITTILGTGTASSTGDGGQATSATTNYPDAVALDSQGNIYVAEKGRVRRIDATSKVVTTYAGSNGGGSGGDGGLATAASLNNPKGIAFDQYDNLYISDTGNHRIRKVDAVTKIITTIAGTGTASFSGDNGQATSATLNTPRSIVLDRSGNLVFVDFSNFRIRKINLTSGVITTVAGNGSNGNSLDNLAATAVALSPFAVAVDGAGNIFISERVSLRVRKVDAITNLITTFAGIPGSTGFSGDGGAATAAQMNSPTGVMAINSGNAGTIGQVNATLGITRTDVVNLTGRSDYLQSGWMMDFGVSTVQPGFYTLDAVATDSSNSTTVLTPAKTIFIQQNLTPSIFTTAGSFWGMGNLIANTWNVRNFSFSNAGAAPLHFTSLSATNGFVLSKSCGDTVAVGASCNFQVGFKPTGLGAFSGQGTIISDDPTSPLIVDLAATGVDLTLSLTRPRRPARSPSASNQYEFELNANGADLGWAELSCSTSTPAAACSLDQKRVLVDGKRPVRVTATARKADLRSQRLATKGKLPQQYALTVTVTAGDLRRSITIPAPSR